MPLSGSGFTTACSASRRRTSRLVLLALLLFHLALELVLLLLGARLAAASSLFSKRSRCSTPALV
jgi:hypothetical protein